MSVIITIITLFGKGIADLVIHVNVQCMVKRAVSKVFSSFSFLIVPSLPPKLCFFKVGQFVLDTLSVNLSCGTSMPTFFLSVLFFFAKEHLTTLAVIAFTFQFSFLIFLK